MMYYEIPINFIISLHFLSALGLSYVFYLVGIHYPLHFYFQNSKKKKKKVK